MANDRIKVEYIKAKGENQYLKIELYYSLGGYNMFSYRQERRGYYISCTPVKRENYGGCSMESFMAFSGQKILVHECARKGKTAEQTALGRWDEYKGLLLTKYASLLPDVA